MRQIIISISAIFFVIFLLGYWIFQLKDLDKFPLIQIKVTIPEGYTANDIADRFAKFRGFNKEEFLTLAEDNEGYLFPDTYFFNGNETPQEIIKKMKDNFDKKVGAVDKNVLIMASLLEREAKITEDRKLISGILWKRLSAGMPLQVDASSDTYEYKGLPDRPICNPGLEAIDAALHPVQSPYWYYLSDKDGKIHYAKTFEEHKINKAKYLN